MGAPTKGLAEGCEDELCRFITAIGLFQVGELLDDDCLGLIDDHAPCGIAIRLQLGRFLDYPGQSARETAKSAGSETHIAKIKVKSSTDSLFVLDIGTVGDRSEILGQVFERNGGSGRTGAAVAQGMRSCGGLRFWPAETRSGIDG